MQEYPVQGRMWLAPDTESAETLFTRLRDFQTSDAKAFWRGPEHVAKATARAEAATRALATVQAIEADRAKPVLNGGGSFIVCGSEPARPAAGGDTWLLVFVCLALIGAWAIWLSRPSEPKPIEVRRPIATPARQVTQAPKSFLLPKKALVP